MGVGGGGSMWGIVFVHSSFPSSGKCVPLKRGVLSDGSKTHRLATGALGNQHFNLKALQAAVTVSQEYFSPSIKFTFPFNRAAIEELLFVVRRFV